MLTIVTQDINAISDVAIILSCVFLFYRWRIKNRNFGGSFLVVAVLFFMSFLLNIYRINDITNTFLRGANSVVFTAALAYACTHIEKKCGNISVVFSLYAVFLVSLFFAPDLNSAYVLLRVIGFVILLPYFTLLFAFEHHEIRFVAFTGISAIFLSMLFWGTLLVRPEIGSALPWYAVKVLFAAMFLLLAHYSIHHPHKVVGGKAEGGRK